MKSSGSDLSDTGRNLSDTGRNATPPPLFPELPFPLDQATSIIFKQQDINIQLKFDGQGLQLPKNFQSDPKIKFSFSLFCAIHQTSCVENFETQKSCYVRVDPTGRVGL